MTRRRLALFGVALLAIFGLVCVAVAAANAAPLPPRVHSASTSEGFLDDGQGNGFAASIAPKAHLSAGRYFYSIANTAGAWRTRLSLDLLCNSKGTVNSSCPFSGSASWENGILSGDQMVLIQLKASTSWCAALENNGIDLEKCNPTFLNQIWVLKGYYFYNVQGTNDNSSGNPWTLSNPCAGCHLLAADIGAYGNYHQLWTFSTSSVMRLSAYTRPAARSCKINVKVTHGTDTTDAHIVQGCGEKIRAWETFAGSSTTQYGPWKTSGDSVAWRNTGTSPDAGGYQRESSTGIHTVTTF